MLNGNGWLLSQLGGTWTLVTAGPIESAALPVVTLDNDLARDRYGLSNGGAYLVRPDQYIAARWQHFAMTDLEDTAWAS